MSSLYRYIFFVILLLGVSSPCQAGTAPFSVGVVFSADNSLNRETYKAFTRTLHASGFGPDKLKLFVQKPHADLFSWANSARRAEAAGIDVLVTFGSPVTRIALRETSSLQVVFAGVFTPLEAPIEGHRIVSGRDLKLASGIYSEVPLATLVKAYVEAHGAGTVTAVFHQADLDASYQLVLIRQAAAIYGLTVNSVVIDPLQFSTSLHQLNDASDAFIVSNLLFEDEQLDSLFAHLQNLKRPVLGLGSGLAEKGALVSLENDQREQGTVAAQQLVKLLEGHTGIQLPRQKPREVNLVLNLPVARSLNLKMPFDLLSAATRIIR